MKKRAPRRPPRRPKWIVWLLTASVVGMLGFALSQMSGIAYTEREIRVVDFSALTATQKRRALEEANTARCTCGCGMGLAQCVATDSTCPIREGNIDRINEMVRRAAR
jgi:hypothetical protein